MRHAARWVGDLRLVKDETELSAMRAAMAITDEAQGAVLGHLTPGMTEFKIQALVEYVFKALGAEALAFPSIIGSGPFSCTLHYDKNRRTMKRGDLVICDIGARKGFYCADITRTYPVSGRFTKRQRKVYDIVLRAQAEALSAARPGSLVKDVHQAATEVIAQAGFAPYFFHGTSHYLGLDPHDAGSYDRPLEPGVVITIEPGIYIAAEELGVRIEDDVLITPQGAEYMTHAPRDPGEIEKALCKPRRAIVV
jgi:Xaa-Pro aminopeptidase